MYEPIDYVLDNNSLFTDSTLEKNQLLKEITKKNKGKSPNYFRLKLLLKRKK